MRRAFSLKFQPGGLRQRIAADKGRRAFNLRSHEAISAKRRNILPKPRDGFCQCRTGFQRRTAFNTLSRAKRLNPKITARLSFIRLSRSAPCAAMET